MRVFACVYVCVRVLRLLQLALHHRTPVARPFAPVTAAQPMELFFGGTPRPDGDGHRAVLPQHGTARNTSRPPSAATCVYVHTSRRIVASEAVHST